MNSNSKLPKFKKEKFICPYCHTFSSMEWEKELLLGEEFIKMDDSLPLYKNNNIDKLYLAKCINCEKKTVWINGNCIFPDIVVEEPDENMPDNVKQIYNEAGLIYNKSPRAACALLRLAIDMLCNELGERNGDLNTKIGNLVKKGLPSYIQKELDIVRVVGNYAVHPGLISFDVDNKETASKLMCLVNNITSQMITQKEKIEAWYEELPKDKKEAIDNRDKLK